MINYFIGKTQPWLEAELAKAQDEFAAGNTVMNVTTGDTQTGAQVQVNIRERIEHMLYALNKLNATKYPASDIRRVSMTQVQVYGEE